MVPCTQSFGGGMKLCDQFPIKIDAKVNIKADSKDAVKVWDKFVDTVAAPFRCWAKTKEPVSQAKAEVNAAQIRVIGIKALMADGLPREEAEALVLRSEQRELLQTVREQHNIEAIVRDAVEFLPRTVDDKPVEEDWVAEFFEQCKNISNEKMRTVWSKILAGEVAQPGSFSRRTLSFVRQMSESEANLFTKFCAFVWSDSASKMFSIADYSMIGAEFDVTRTELMELQSLGLIEQELDVSRITEIERCEEFTYFDESYEIRHQGGYYVAGLERVFLTPTGRSLVKIAEGKKNDSYKLAAINILQLKGITVVKLSA
jgi:hypothetical protein